MMMRCFKMLCAIFAFVLCASCASFAADAEFVTYVCGELESRASSDELRRVFDRSTGLNVFYDAGAYDAIFKRRGDEAFAEWFRALPQEDRDAADGAVAVILTAQRFDGVSSPQIGEHKFGFMESEGVVLMRRDGMRVFDDPWGAVGRFLKKSERVDYGSANIGDEGGSFICGGRTYKCAAFAGLLRDMKSAFRMM